MNIKFIKKYYEKHDGRPISFWCAGEGFTFEITYDEKEDVSIFEEELRLNLENQLSGYFGFERDDAIQRKKETEGKK